MVRTLLQARSEFSLLAGVPSVPDLVARAKALGYASLALTDVNRMSGLILFHQECERAGLDAILGVELREARIGREGREEDRPDMSVVLLARNDAGYGDLCELITRRKMRGTAFSMEEAFREAWPNLIFLSESLKVLELLGGGPNRGSLFGALIRHSPEARAHGREVEAWCDREGIPAAACGDAWFLDKGDHELHRVLRASDLNSTLSRLRPGEYAPEGAWLRAPGGRGGFDPNSMSALFDTRPEALEIAEGVASRCKSRPPMGKWIMPEIEVPAGYTPETWLGHLAREGLQANYGNSGDTVLGKARAVQETELAVIGKLGYASYFLMVKDVYDKAGELLAEGYRTPKDCSLLRGSAANSLTFYNLGIGRLDPIEHDLYFQRFLNEDRASPPDADLDFGWDEREKMLEYVVERYGRDRVAITCTFQHFRFKAAFREAAKVFGYAEEQVTEILEARDSKVRQRADGEIRMLEGWAKRLRGRPRFLGQHPGGLIITNQPIWRHVACEWSGGAKNRLITQVDMHSGIDPLGLIKFDLLGNGSLSVLRDTLDQIRAEGAPDPEVWDLKKCTDDREAWRVMAEGRTRGIFYLESPAQTRLNIKANVERFDEVVITSSLIRPAGTPYARTYVERHRKWKRGIVDWEFLHPSLEPILGHTHDVCAFQEDVTKICHHIAGLSYKKADAVRKQMNSQHEGALPGPELVALAKEFIAGCITHGKLSAAQADELWKRVASFTGFSFCKSHSASYAQLSYQCVWLKTHHPAAFLSAVISNNHGFYRREIYLNEARRMGIDLLPLDINHSSRKYVGKGRAIRPGFLHLRDLSARTLEAIEKDRSARGEFQSLPDFLRRVPASRREAEHLILAGAFHDFGLTQPELLFHLDGVYGTESSAHPSLFGAGEGYRARDLHPGLQDYNLMQQCLNEQRLLGYMLSGNPLDVLSLHPASRDAVPAAELGLYKGRRVKIFGLYVTQRLHRVMKSGRLMQFLTLEDKSGTVDILFWPDMLERNEEMLLEPGPFEIWGKVTEEWDAFTLEAERVRPVAFIPGVVDFDLASARLRAGLVEAIPDVARDVKAA